MPQALTARQAAAEEFAGGFVAQSLVRHGVEATELVDDHH